MVVIQSAARSFVARRKVFRAVRDEEIPALKSTFEANPTNWNLLKRISALVLFAEDNKNLVWICQVV